MRRLIIVLVALTAACSGELDSNDDSKTRTPVVESDVADMPADRETGDETTVGDAGNVDAGYVQPDGAPVPDVDNSCTDADRDGVFVGCIDFTGVPGPDCDDADPDNWGACETCADADADGYFVDCDRYTVISGPDCDDDNANAWAACASCVDGDGDGWFGVCDAYGGIEGPDCSDADGDNWASCATCLDGDADGYFTGCDRYNATQGPDCNDGDSNVRPGRAEVPGNGVDDDCNPSTPDATCDYVPVPAQNPEAGVMAGVTAEHNRWRARVGVAPLTWNATLAASAAAYVSTCVWAHDANRSPDGGFSYVGENLYASSQMPSSSILLNSVQSWAGERTSYTYGRTVGQSNLSAVGHYTQVVWDDTTQVGCGYKYCNSIQGLNFGGTIVACRYGPGGNYSNATPYDFTAGVCLDLDNDDVRQGVDSDDTDRSVQ